MPRFKTIGLAVLEKIVKGFNYILAWRPSWSCDHDHFHKIHVPASHVGSTKFLTLIGQVVSEMKLVIYMYLAPGQGKTTPRVFFFQKCNFSVKVICCKFIQFNKFETVFHIWTWRPSWSCDLDHLCKLWFPFPKEAPHEIWFLLAKRLQGRRSLKMVDDAGRTDGDSMGMVYHKLTL